MSSSSWTVSSSNSAGFTPPGRGRSGPGASRGNTRSDNIWGLRRRTTSSSWGQFPESSCSGTNKTSCPPPSPPLSSRPSLSLSPGRAARFNGDTGRQTAPPPPLNQMRQVQLRWHGRYTTGPGGQQADRQPASRHRAAHLVSPEAEREGESPVEHPQKSRLCWMVYLMAPSSLLRPLPRGNKHHSLNWTHLMSAWWKRCFVVEKKPQLPLQNPYMHHVHICEFRN